MGYGYPGYNFMPQMQQGQMQQQGMGQMQSPMLGQDMLQQPNPEHSHHGGMSPLMMLSPFAAMMSQNPKMGMAMLSPFMGMLGALK